MRPSVHIGWLALLLVPNCLPAAPSAPQFLNESAKRDLDKASVAVLASVRAVSDDKIHSAPGGYRPIKVTLDVQQVIKGELASRTVCVDYYALDGAILGHLPVWVEPGSRGIFFLTSASPCYRVVNDSRAYIKANRMTPTDSVSSETFIAEATLPRGCAGNSYAYRSAEDLWSITIPLVGSRVAMKLLANTYHDADPSVSACACIVTALVWKLRERCLLSVGDDGIQEQAQEIAKANDKLNLQEEHQLQDDPAAWLKTTVDGMGMDGTLLRLGGLISQSRSPISGVTCALLKKTRGSVSFQVSLARGRDHSNEIAERAAIKQLDQWFDSGCQAGSWQRLENPLINP
jgi:hypothetical protein